MLQGDVGCVDSILPPATGVKDFDPQFSALTLDLGQNLTLTLDQILTVPINPAPINLFKLGHTHKPHP